MTNHITAMKQAFDALLFVGHTSRSDTAIAVCAEATDVLRQAIAQAEKQEPVCDKSPRDCSSIICNVSGVCKNSEPLANPIANQPETSGSPMPVACKHKRYSNDVTEDIATCYDCGAEGRMRFVANDTSPPQAEKQEPVNGYTTSQVHGYTAPPRKKWVGLTDDEFKFIASKYSLPTEVGLGYFHEEIEAKLKEKNT